MENRKTLHDYSLVLILLTALDIFSLISNTITNYLNGVYDEALATVEPNLLTAVKVCLIVFFVLEVILIVSQILIGCKGLKVSRTPVASKGYITAAKVFFVLNIIAAVAAVIVLIDSQSSRLIDNSLNLLCAIADVVLYAYFIKAAKAVRRSVLENA